MNFMSDHPEISRLITQTLNGSDDAFCEIVKFYTPVISMTSGRFAGIESDREDLAQEVFIRVYRSLRNYRGTGSFEGWLRKLAVHTCLDWFRKNRRKPLSLSELTNNDTETRQDEFLDSRESDGHKETESGESLKIIQKAMEHLSPEERMIIVLKELEGRSIDEISELTGWSQSNVKVRAHRAREKMKTILIQQGVLR